jgi:hypothetical protein
MKLRRRQKRGKAQALDVVASAVKGMAELHLAQRAGKGVGKGAKNVGKGVKKASRLKRVFRSTPAKLLAGGAAVGGAGAVVAKKLRGGDPEPIYTPPAPSEPMAVATAPEVDAVVEAAADAAADDALGPTVEPQAEAAGDAGVVIELVPEPEPAIASEPAIKDAAEAAAAADPAIASDPAIEDGADAAATADAPPDPAAASAAVGAEAPTDTDADAIEPPGEAGEEPATDDKPASGSGI